MIDKPNFPVSPDDYWGVAVHCGNNCIQIDKTGNGFSVNGISIVMDKNAPSIGFKSVLEKLGVINKT